jgi:hypothetical protein
MIDEQTGEVSEQVTVETQEVPASESQPEAVDQQLEETQDPEPETGENEVDDTPPKDNAAWAAMRAENKRLKEATERVDPEYLEKLRGATAPQEPYAPQFTPVNDDADYSEVTQRLNWTQQQAMSAQQQLARMQQQLELQQDRQAEEAFPELKSDKEFQQLVAEKKLAARVLGRDATTLEIARSVKKLLSRREEQVAVQTAQATKQHIIDKQAATAEGKGQASPGSQTTGDDELRQKVRMGNADAETEAARRLIADLEF